MASSRKMLVKSESTSKFCKMNYCPSQRFLLTVNSLVAKQSCIAKTIVVGVPIANSKGVNHRQASTIVS